MLVVRVLLILLCSTCAAFGTEKRTYLLSTELGCGPGHAPGSQECYIDVTNKIDDLVAPAGSMYHSPRLTTRQGGATLYSYDGYAYAMPEDVTVTIHGLYENAEQLNSALDGPSQNSAFGNAIEMTLPGHHAIGEDTSPLEKVSAKPSTATANDWVRALDSTMKIAKTMGKKVNLVGQSTGGALAVLGALKYPDQVKSVVLYEPALEVQVQWSFLSCHLGGWITDSKRVRSELIKHGHADVNAQDMRLGCEVWKLTDALYRRYATNATSRAEKIRALARQIHVPLYLLNNEHDDVVSTSANKLFYEALPGWKRYQSINIQGKEHHGNVSGHYTAISAAIGEVRALGARDAKSKALYALNVKNFFAVLPAPPAKNDGDWNADVLLSSQKSWAADVRDILRDGDVVRRSCQFVRGNCAQTQATLKSLVDTLDAFDSLVIRIKDENIGAATQNIYRTDVVRRGIKILDAMRATALSYER